MTVVLEPARQVWFAPVDNPSDKSSFIIRDDTYTVSSANIGRTLRLGDPVDIGPQSGEQQTDWSGGIGQHKWNDTSMVEISDLDGTDPNGSLRPWPGLRAIRTLQSNGVYPTAVMSAAQGTTPQDNQLLVGQSNGFVSRVDLAGTSNNVYTCAASTYPTCMSPFPVSDTAGQTQFNIAIGMSDGVVIYVNCQTWAATNIRASASDTIYAMAPWGRKLAVAINRSIWTWDYPTGGPAAWAPLTNNVSEIDHIVDMAVQGSLIYFIGQAQGTRAHLYVTDGATVTRLHTFHNTYAKGILSLNGAIYVLTQEFYYNGETAGSYTARDGSVLYRYANGALVEIYSQLDVNVWGTDKNTFGGPGLSVWNGNVVWTYKNGPLWLRTGDDGLTQYQRFGAMVYDPVRDAVHIGPTVQSEAAGLELSTIGTWHGQLTMGVKTSGYGHTLVTSPIREMVTDTWDAVTHSLNDVASNAQKWSCISSRFDAGLPSVPKVWLRLNLKVNFSSSLLLLTGEQAHIKVYYSPYDLKPVPQWTYLGEASGPSSGVPGMYYIAGGALGYGLYTCSFDLTNIPSSEQLRYKIEIVAPVANTGETEMADKVVVDDVTLEYMIPPNDKAQYRFSVFGTDAQRRMDGTTNPLTTNTALANKLKSYWRSKRPLYFWEPEDSTAPPTTTDDAKVVMLTDYSASSFAVSSEDTTEVVSMHGVTLYEVA